MLEIIKLGFIGVAMMCEAKIENHTKTWTKGDQKAYQDAKIRCVEIYGENSCMVKFMKKAERTYSVICR